MSAANHLAMDSFIKNAAWRAGWRLKNAAWHWRRYKDTDERTYHRVTFNDAVWNAKAFVQDVRSICGSEMLAVVIVEMRKGCCCCKALKEAGQ